MNVKRKRRKYV